MTEATPETIKSDRMRKVYQVLSMAGLFDRYDISVRQSLEITWRVLAVAIGLSDVDPGEDELPEWHVISGEDLRTLLAAASCAQVANDDPLHQVISFWNGELQSG